MDFSADFSPDRFCDYFANLLFFKTWANHFIFIPKNRAAFTGVSQNRKRRENAGEFFTETSKCFGKISACSI